MIFCPGRRLARQAVYTRVAVALAIGSALLPAGGSRQAQADEKVIAKVDGVVIDQRDYDLAQQMFVHDLKGMEPKARNDFLVQYLIDTALMAKEARKQNVAIDEAALQRNFDFLRNKALMEALLGKTARAAITDEAVHSVYEQTVKEVTAEPVLRLRSIHFKVEDVKDEKAMAAAEARANEAIARVKKGEDFAKVSEDMTGTSMPATLQEVGYMSRQQMGPVIAPVAYQTNVGDISAPIKTDHGFDVVKVESQQTRTAPDFESVRERFEMLVGRRAQVEMMEKLRSAAKIERSADLQPADGAKDTANGKEQVAKVPK
jgi:parvulin-like peptidyl-prolyl isomerase